MAEHTPESLEPAPHHLKLVVETRTTIAFAHVVETLGALAQQHDGIAIYMGIEPHQTDTALPQAASPNHATYNPDLVTLVIDPATDTEYAVITQANASFFAKAYQSNSSTKQRQTSRFIDSFFSSLAKQTPDAKNRERLQGYCIEHPDYPYLLPKVAVFGDLLAAIGNRTNQIHMQDFGPSGQAFFADLYAHLEVDLPTDQ